MPKLSHQFFHFIYCEDAAVIVFCERSCQQSQSTACIASARIVFATLKTYYVTNLKGE